MSRPLKSPAMVRRDAFWLVRNAADQRAKDGDPEGCDLLIDLAAAILAIDLIVPAR